MFNDKVKAMADKDLKDLLSSLHTQLSGADQVDEQTKGLMKTVISDIENLIDPAVETGDEHHSTVMESLEKQALSFETDHPSLMASIREVIDALSRMGI
jgi:seryl-tRNA synthetase